jgi:hypothetical protein
MNILDSVGMMCAEILMIAAPVWVLLVWIMDKIRDGVQSL